MSHPKIHDEATVGLNDPPETTTAAAAHNIPMKRLPSDKDGLNELSIARGSNIWARFKFELKRENLWFSGNYPNTYGKLHWTRAFGARGSGCWCCSRAYGDEREATYLPSSPWVWIPWRLLVFVYLSGVFIYSITTFWHDGTWFYYLTNWQSLIFMVYGLVALLSSIYIHMFHYDSLSGDMIESAKLIGAHPSCPEGSYRIPLIVRLTWVLHGLSMSLGIWVTLVFWLHAAIFGLPDPSRAGYELIDHFSTVMLVILDFSFASFPWLLLQFVWSSTIAVAFTIWSGIHYHLGLINKFDDGNYLYKGLDWSKPGPTGVGVAVLIAFGVPLVSIAVWILSSESMGRCAPKRLVPWVDQDGSGGHRLKSYKKNQAKPLKESDAIIPAESEHV